MHVEQYYNSNWASQGAGKGDIDPRHTSWVPGLCVFGNWRLRSEFGGLVVSLRYCQACALDAFEIIETCFDRDHVLLTLRNTLDKDLELPVTVCHPDGARLIERDYRSNDRGDARFDIKIDAGADTRLVLRLSENTLYGKDKQRTNR